MPALTPLMALLIGLAALALLAWCEWEMRR